MKINTKQAVQELISYTIVTDKQSLVDLLKQYGVKLSSDPSNAEVTTAVLVANKKNKAFSNDLAKLLGKKLPKAGETLKKTILATPKKIGKQFSNIVGDSSDFGFTGVDDVTYMKGFTGVDDFSDFTGWDEWNYAPGDPLTLNIKPIAPTADSLLKPTTLTKKQARLQASATRKASGQPTKVGSALSSLWSFVKTNVLTSENVNAGIQYGLNKVNQDSLARQNALEQQSLMLQQQQQQLQSQQGVKAGVSGNTILYIGIGVIALVGIGFLIVRQSKK